MLLLGKMTVKVSGGCLDGWESPVFPSSTDSGAISFSPAIPPPPHNYYVNLSSWPKPFFLKENTQRAPSGVCEGIITVRKVWGNPSCGGSIAAVLQWLGHGGFPQESVAVWKGQRKENGKNYSSSKEFFKNKMQKEHSESEPNTHNLKWSSFLPFRGSTTTLFLWTLFPCASLVTGVKTSWWGGSTEGLSFIYLLHLFGSQIGVHGSPFLSSQSPSEVNWAMCDRSLI